MSCPKFVIIILWVCILTACAPSIGAAQKAITITQEVWTPTPTLISPSFATILGSNGFVLESLYEDNCATPCTSYEHMAPWLTAKVFDNGAFEIFGSKFDSQYIYPIITQLYNQNVTNWIADNLALLLNDPKVLFSVDEKYCQVGTVNSFTINECMMDYGNRVWITISPIP
jgi:hypothetical protein